jgi:hypothetical protein
MEKSKKKGANNPQQPSLNKTVGVVQPIWHKDLKNMELEEPSYMIDQLISKGGISAISGVPESHKSFIALEMAKCISQGMPFLGKFETERGKVFLMDKENGKGRIISRLNTLTDEILELSILAEHDLKIDTKGMPDTIIKYCETYGIGTVILDSLSSMHSADENSNSQMSGVFAGLIKLANEGLTVIFIHHEPKSSGRNPEYASLRGAGDILAKCDIHLSLRHPKDDGKTILVKQLKNRDAERLPEFKIVVHQEEGRTSFEYLGELPKQVGVNQRTDEAVIKLLTDDGELYQGQIIKSLQGVQGIGGEKKILNRLTVLTTSGKIDYRVAPDEKNKNYYSVNIEQPDE